MRDARTPEGTWVKDAQVYVEGDPEARADRSSWTAAAILEVHPRDVPFQIGWRTQQFDAAEFYSLPAETHEAKLAMEVGDQGVWFVVRPLDGRTALVLELVEVTNASDDRYAETPHY
ncbi:MAG TPA: hypothetical protein VLE72_01375 [Candidatus Saccharimonadales bacterium]|nr:hypothetical protein [Candidatus Saccharimonadales bacterium]